MILDGDNSPSHEENGRNRGPQSRKNVRFVHLKLLHYEVGSS